jgi:hypothetical protein
MKAEPLVPFIGFICRAPQRGADHADRAEIRIWWVPPSASDGPPSLPLSKPAASYDCASKRSSETFSELGEQARCNYQCFVLLLAVALRDHEEAPLSTGEIRQLRAWETVAQTSIEARLRALLRGSRLIRREENGVLRLAKGARFCVEPQTETEAIRLWLGPPARGPAPFAAREPEDAGRPFLWRAIELFKTGDRTNRMEADRIMEENASRFDYAWLLGLGSEGHDKHERAMMARAIGHHPDRDARALDSLFAALRSAEADGTLYSYRVLASMRRLLVEGHRRADTALYWPMLRRLRNTGGLTGGRRASL